MLILDQHGRQMGNDWKRLAISLYEHAEKIPEALTHELNRLLQYEKSGSIVEGRRLVPLTQGQVAYVDDADYERVSQHKWFAIKDSRGGGDTFYARTKIRGKAVSLHRFLIEEIPEGQVVDHIDRNPLNNCRDNLRVVNKYQSSQNRKAWVRRDKQSTAQSLYKGVYGRPKTDGSISWRAVIKKNSTIYNLGSFATEEEAARAYDIKAEELHGEYAVLNFARSIR